MLLHRKIGPTVQSTIYTNRLISSLSIAAIDNAFVRRISCQATTS